MLLVLTWLRAGEYFIGSGSVALYLLTIIPHEILHALCYKGDVYLYQNLGRGMVFVSGAERMSKGTKTPWHTTTKKIPSGISPGTGSILRVHSKWTTNPVPMDHYSIDISFSRSILCPSSRLFSRSFRFACNQVSRRDGDFLFPEVWCQGSSYHCHRFSRLPK